MICTCSCMHECVHVRECVRVHICVSACVMLHMEVGGPLQESALSFFHVSCGNQTQVLRLPNLGTGNRTWVLEGKAKNLELIAQSGWQARFSCLCLPRAWITGCHSQLFSWILSDWTQVFMFIYIVSSLSHLWFVHILSPIFLWYTKQWSLLVHWL